MKLSAENAVEYLRARGYLGPGDAAQARELTGGVSNTVIHVAPCGGEELVLKQVRGQLDVAEPWFCSVERVWREVEVLRLCSRLIDTIGTSGPFKVAVP